MATASAILWLRSIASCFFLTLAILSMALWVRSCYFIDSIATIRYFTVDGDLPVRHRTQLVVSGYELIEMRFGNEFPAFEGNQKLRFEVFSISPFKNSPSDRWSWQIFKFPTGTARIVRFPHDILVFSFTLVAIAIRPRPRFNFSLRDLFTLSTVAALMIGPLAFWLRSIS
jgi:hypothetical protein